MAPRPKPIEDRFWSKVREDGSGCWIWTGSRTKAGYGSIGRGGRNDGKAMAHRVAYELVVGAIPTGMQIDHLCRNRACVNPAHLEPVTHRENILRGQSPHAQNARKTHCKHGHPLDDDNMHREPDGWRRCRACGRIRARRYRARKKAGT